MLKNTPALIQLKDSIDDTCAPVWYHAEKGRTQHTPFCFTCPICQNIACALDKNRSVVMEGTQGEQIDLPVDNRQAPAISYSSYPSPGVWIPMVCGNDPNHKFTLTLDVDEENNSLVMTAHLEESTYEFLYPDYKEN